MLPACTLQHPPLCYVSGGLEEAGVVVLLQALLGLCDEGARALQTLSAVCDLLGQLAQLHHLKRHTQTNAMLCTHLNHLLTLRLDRKLSYSASGKWNVSVGSEHADNNTTFLLPALNRCYYHIFLRAGKCSRTLEKKSAVLLLIFYAHLLHLKITMDDGNTCLRLHTQRNVLWSSV